MRFANWTNQAETTFLIPPTDTRADYAVRIIFPTKELSFADHLTLGSCAAWLRSGGAPKDPRSVIQECAIGLVEIDCSGEVPAFVVPPALISDGRQRTLETKKAAPDRAAL